MHGKWTLLSLMILNLSLQAETQRREPSLLLGYERELKKANEFQQEEANPFIKNTPAPVTVVKPTLPTLPVVHAPKVIAVQETPLPVLKNAKSDTDTIGQDEKPFLMVPKPAPVASAALCPDEKESRSQKEDGVIVKNLKNAKDKLLVKAKEFLGTPYGFGNKAGDRTDCSGFTQQVFGQFGVSLPRSAAEQARLGMDVDLSELQVGDLLFYRTYKSDPSHVAIYAGNGQIIHASYAAKKVQYDSIDKAYYKQRFLYAKRLSLGDTYAD